MDSGAYEVILQRLQVQKNKILDNVALLNKERKEVFGATAFELLANLRINTANSCVAKDIMAMGGLCILGYNVQFGLKQDIGIADVFSIYRFDGKEFIAQNTALLEQEDFVTEFKNLYKYYRNASFSRFHIKGNLLYMVFQQTANVQDIKAFKWLMEGETIQFMDGRSAHEVKYPDQHDFTWEKATRDMQRTGKSPHVSILDRVFVETIHGDLSIKIEDNTDTGKGIYHEDVEQKDQTLDDGEIYFADLGNIILLRIKPYLENNRFFIFNDRLKTVTRADTLADAGLLLPEAQGILLSNGYYLQNGENKIFDRKLENVKFSGRIDAPNGEDFLYVFYQEVSHSYILLSYNVIEQQVQTPILCNGFTIFENGQLLYFISEKDPTRHHLIQVWQTAFTKEMILNETLSQHHLYKIGNKPIVQAMAEVRELLVLLDQPDNYEGLYDDILDKSRDIYDSYFWMQDNSHYQFAAALTDLKQIATNAIDEFQKVVEMRSNAAKLMADAEERVSKLVFDVRTSKKETLQDYVKLLSALRLLKGELITLKKVAYTNEAVLTEHEKVLTEKSDELSKACVEFLLREDALQPYQLQIQQLQEALPKAAKVVEVKALEQQSTEIAGALEMLIDIVNQLKIDDASQSAKIIENISQLFSSLNQLRTQIQNRRNELNKKESQAEFQAQMTLLDQSIINFLDMADSAEKVNEYLSKLTIQLEEIEMRFADWDEVQIQTGEKRQMLYDSFEARKMQLLEQKNKRAGQLQQAAERIITGVKNKAKNLESESEINAFFSSDLMVDRARQMAQELIAMEDATKSEEILQQLLVVQQEAIRNLKDRKELYVDGAQILAMGKHRFAIQSQNVALTLTNRDGVYHYHITGTSYFEPIQHPELDSLKAVSEVEYVSETKVVPRAVYLAWRVLQQNPTGHTVSTQDLEPQVNAYLSAHPSEGYVKGVHDKDALLLVTKWLQLREDLGVLSFLPEERALAHIFWHYLPTPAREDFTRKITAVKFLKSHYSQQKEIELFIEEAAQKIKEFIQKEFPYIDLDAKAAAAYLYSSPAGITMVSHTDNEIFATFKKHLKADFIDKKYQEYMQELKDKPAMLWALVESWLYRFAVKEKIDIPSDLMMELTAMLITEGSTRIETDEDHHSIELQGLQSIQQEGAFVLDHYYWTRILKDHDAHIVPQFLRLQQLKKELLLQKSKQLSLENFKTEVLTSFVRNQLINQVYFPLIGANFSKQIGESGDAKRSDRSGLLLLVSPPGYGKTTLMEYVADRLGLVFIKINGPSLGHNITSVDPGEAKDAAAKSELGKLNLALEMGDNVMLYIDDIQHCNTEFLQKFISLADGQRRMDGVFNNEPKTYDLRGKRFALVMAGNPYTESGEIFKIPDMLSNRADIYNLGDMTSVNKAQFEMSMLENALMANTHLRKLSQSGMENLYKLVAYVQDPERNLPNLDGNFTASEIQDFIQVVKHALQVRATVLKVNETYIQSAGVMDAFREEPPFKLQGSYRNMNKMLASVIPIMTEAEVTELVANHYKNESQTLTKDAEANLLKLKEIMGLLTAEESSRWEDIKKEFKKYRMLKGLGDQDKFSQIIAQMNQFVDGLEGIKEVLRGKS